MGEVVKEYEKDGFNIVVEVEPDDDCRPGDDDVSPVLESISWSDYYAIQDNDRDEYGQFVAKPVIGQGRYPGEPLQVSLEEIDRLVRSGWGDNPPRRAVKLIREDAQGWVDGDRYYVGVIVSAERNGFKTDASLWGIDCDRRDQKSTDEYLVSVADEMAEEAIDQAADALLGGLAPLALSY